MFGFFKKIFSNTITINEKYKDCLISTANQKNKIKIGSQLIVPENHTAYIVCKKKVLDNFDVGCHKLTGASISLLAKELKLNKQNKSSSFINKFKAFIYYVNLSEFNNIDFISPDKVVIKDKRFLKARVGIKGKFSFKTINHEELLSIIIKDCGFVSGNIALDRLKFWVAKFTAKKIKKNKPGLEELFNRESECFKGLHEFIAKKFYNTGIEITSIEITDVLLPKKVYKKTDLSFLEVDTRVKPVEDQLEHVGFAEKLEKDAINNKIMLENNMVAIESGETKSIQYKKCEKCGSVNPAQAKFCFNCATPFKKTCQNCGDSLNENDFVCPNCKSIVV